jgi:glycosyltransferase involved in cell wall biosynthesis
VKVRFCQPPAAQRIGGLDAAIQGLSAALKSHGVGVFDEPSADQEAHLVHFHGLWQRQHLAIAEDCRRRGIPYLVSPHGMLEPWAWRHKWWKKWPYFQLFEKRHLARAGALLATAPAEAQRLRTMLPQQRVESLPLGLSGDARPAYGPARVELGWAPEELVLLFLSRIHVKKGLDLLLRALAGMKWPAVLRLVIVGDGDPVYVESLKRFAADHAARLPRIDWVGPVWGDARWKYFQGADLFCLPTHSENFGLAVLEACQVGTPVLTTIDTPWKSELEIGRGYIAAPTVKSVAQQVARFFAGGRHSAIQRQALSGWAWERFAWPGLAPQYVALYKTLLNTPAEPICK